MFNLKKRPWVFALLLSIFISLNFFWSKPLVPGFDSPFYLTEIRTFARGFPNPLTYPHLDRYLTIAFPAILARAFNFDAVAVYRIAISIVYMAMSLVLYRLFKNLTQNELAAGALSAAMVVSPFLINYSTMLFANFTAFLYLFAFFAVETEKTFKYKNIILGVIFGLVFYIHNFSFVSMGLIILSYLFFRLLITKDLIIIKKGLLIFIIAALLGCLSISRYIKTEFFFPKVSAYDSVRSSISKLTNLQAPTLIGNETQRIKDSLSDHSGKFWLYFFPLFMLTVFVFKRKELLKYSLDFTLPLAIFIPSLVLTFQPLYQLNFLPERFVTLVVLSTYFFYATMISLPSFKRTITFLSVLPLFFNYLSADNQILDKGYRSFSEHEIKFYQDIKPLINKNGVVLLSTDHYYWGKYFLDGYQVLPGEHFISCGTINEVGYFSNVNFTLAKLLGENDPNKAIQYVSDLKIYLPNRNIYILSDTSLSCGSGKILQNLTVVRKIYISDNLIFYEII